MSGNSRRACSMPTGSCARTLAPISSSPVTIGIGLEGEAEHGDGLAAQAAAGGGGDLTGHRALAVVVDGEHRLDDAQLHVMIERALHQRAGILREAGSAEAGPRMQELAADAVVEPNAARDFLHIGADFLGEI